MANYQSVSKDNAADCSNETDGLLNGYTPIADVSPSYKRIFVGGIAGGIAAISFVFLLLQNPSKGIDVDSSLLQNDSGAAAPRSKGGPCVLYVPDRCEPDLICCPNTLVGTLGTCKSCCSNMDCFAKIDQPPAGEFGKRFCIDDECRAYKEGDSSQIPEEGYPLWLTSETLDNSREYRQLVLPRTVYSDVPKPIMTQVWHFDFNEQDASSFDPAEVSYNGTHVTIPSFKMLHAGYSRSYHQFNENESGIATLLAMDNKYSVVADYPLVGFVEKYHTLRYDGTKDTSRGDYIKKLSDEGMKKTWRRSKWQKRTIAQTVALVSRKTIDRQVEGGMDRAIAWQVRRYVNSYPKENTGSLNPNSSISWASHSKKARQAINDAKNPDFRREYKKSEQHCKHFEEGPGVDTTDTHVTFALGVPITTFSGEMVNSPIYYLGLAIGHVTAHYDENKNVLELYFETYSHSRQHSDAKFRGPYPDGLWVSPVAEGRDYAVDPDIDGRGDSNLKLDQPPDDRTGLLHRKQADFTLWSRKRSEVCSQKVLDASFWEAIDPATSDNTIYDSLVESSSLFDTKVVQATRMLNGIVRGMPCASTWMRSDYGRGTHAFGLNEIGVWAHTLGEVRDDKTKEVALADWWDSWECFYGDKDPALCREYD